MNIKTIFKECWRILLVSLGAMIMAFNLKSFVESGNLFPAGFTGLSLLIQEIFLRFFNFSVPFSVINLALNSVPVILSFRLIGHRFTIYSCLMIVLASFFTDLLPSIKVTDDILLAAVFGGVINACAISLCLFAGATSGGTDFIAIYFSEKKGKDAWNYVFIGNAVVLVIAGYLFGWYRALYSIFFQFTSTQVLNVLYRRYQKLTLLIITDKSTEVYQLIRDLTNHDGTLFTGTGCYKKQTKTLLYSVVSYDEIRFLLPKIKEIDPEAFINVLKTKQVNGRFYQRPND